MIDIEKAKLEFMNYVKNYDQENKMIVLKISHAFRVMEQSKNIAESLKLEKEQVDLATLIGLLHDIARFEQMKRYGTYEDKKSIDHGDLGAEMLSNLSFIRRFVSDDKYDNIIIVAVKNHNKYEIQDGLTDLELLHSKIIRDADKLDNFRVKEENDYKSNFPGTENIENIRYEKISDKVYNDFLNHKCINIVDRKTLLDFWVCILAFIYDFNFRSSYKYIKDKNYIDILVDKIEYKNEETKQRMEEIRKCAKEYIDKKVEE